MTATAPHTNRLSTSTSPYLLQHAHNPVDWYPWGPEALERAKREDKPIFLSIGYSACHWCHVMERESFESEEIARVMNENFICIKVDREERPDLDDIYMMATQAFTQSGGWPMSVWLTPDHRPFYAGTYFPPGSRYGRPGFKQVLEYLAQAWREDRDKVTQQADALTDAVNRLTEVTAGDEIVPVDIVTRATDQLARVFDPQTGGISSGGRNKFPPSMAMDVMLRAYHASIEAGAAKARTLELVELTLDHMGRGGIFDHLGGGIARYSTDPQWLVPHFEKMLYDQALVSDIYLKAYQLTKNQSYAATARAILDYVIADLQSPEGGYYSARDADSEGVEGKFYVWTKQQIVDTLGEEDAKLFCDYYDVSDAGNWEGHNILNIPRSAEIVAKLHHIPVERLLESLEKSRKKLFELREKRIKPHLDDKVLASWNGLMIASMAKAYRILGDERYRESATRAAEFITSKMMNGSRLLRTSRRGTAHTPGYLDDYAFMIEALLNLYETTFELKWLQRSESLNATVMDLFRDFEAGGFFFTAKDAEKVLVRIKDSNDSAIPSGNSVHLMNLQRLALLLDRDDLAEEAERTLRFFSHKLGSSPFASERMLSAVDFYHRRPKEMAFIADKKDAAALNEFVNAAWQAYVPSAVFARLLVSAEDMGEAQKKIALVRDKKPVEGKPTVYVCKRFVCQTPSTDLTRMSSQIEPRSAK